MDLRYGSVFSGVGGIDLGFDRAGWSCAFQIEIEKQCQKVLSQHWSEVPRFGDVKGVDGGQLERFGPVDALVGGFPCVDVSVAGRRAGLGGQRSGLFFEFMRLAAELSPRWILLENVPGLLSSNGGRDMGTVVGSLGELGYCAAWRVLDSQYFGVAQRRRRVFIVGHLGEPFRCAGEVLLESEGVSGHSPPGRAEGEEVASTLGGGSGHRGFCDDFERSGAFIPVATHDVSPCLQERGGKGADSDMTQAYVLWTPFDTTQITSIYNRSNPQQGDPCHPLASTGHPPAIASRVGVRRLLPVECERLQGFPDGWTASLSDSGRYRAMGNAVTVPVAEWIARRMRVVHERTVEAQGSRAEACG